MKSYLKTITTLLFTGILFSGCYLNSVHPLVPVDQAELLEGLEGRWETEDQRWTFIHDPRNFPDFKSFSEGYDFEDNEVLEDKIYFLLFENLQDLSSDTVYFLATVKKFGENHFLDLSLFDYEEGNSFKAAHLFPIHTFSKIRVTDQLLTVNFFEDSWVKELIMSNRVRIKHERTTNQLAAGSSEILITASTNELQNFITKYGNDDQAFDDPIGLKRVTNELQ